MECYDTCCDRGKRCVLPREKICCSDCGKINPCYNIQSVPCNVCPSKEPCNCSNKIEKEKWRSNDICKCKQSCWQWILSFLGVGGKLPECCRNVRLTAWESGEVAREALVSKVQQVVNHVSGRDAYAAETRSSKIFEKPESKESEKKTTAAVLSSDKEGQHEETSDDSPDQLSAKDQGQATADKKKKTAKSRSSSLPRGRTKHRKTGGSKSRSTSRSDKQKAKKSGSKTRSGSSSSTSLSQGDKRRKRSRSRSGSTTKIFNPFKGRIPSSSCNVKSQYCPPLPCLPCPGTQPKSYLSCLDEDQIAIFPDKNPSPPHQQSSRCPPTQQSGIRRSNSMSYKTNDTCLQQGPEHCYCCSDRVSKIPLRSQSFDCTQMRFTSPRACCLSAHPTYPRSHTWTCSCSMKSDALMTPYTRGSGIRRPSPSCCQSAVKSHMCPSSCTKACCMPISGMHSSQPYNNKHETHQYTSPSSNLGQASCCAAHNIMKARQNDALCNQLLSRYGYSPPSPRLCPLTCYGCNTTTMCCAATCLKYGNFPGLGGCIACRPMADYTNCTLCCEQSENYTNSRQPRSPELLGLRNQLIEFNQSPCEKKPLCEFQLPPHCIRETGPRSPVGEYLAIIRVPKTVKKQDNPEGIAEEPKETEPAPKKEQAEEAKPNRKKIRKLSRKSTGKARNVNENAKSECLIKVTPRSLQLADAKQGCPCNEPVLAIPSEVSDCWLLHCEESFNNNYGGDSYCISRYSSVGPVQIDFSELNARVNRYSNIPTQSSASSAFVARYSRPNYRTPSDWSDVRAITSYVSQIYNRDTRNLLDPQHCVGSWNRPRSLSKTSNISHKLLENRPLTFNRSTNGTGIESSDMLNTTKYHVRLETAIENKIRELKDAKVFQSPPARRKMYSHTLFEQVTRAHEKPNHPVKRNVPQEEFIRESLDQLNHRAERRKHEFRYVDAFLKTPFPNETSGKQVSQGDVTYQLDNDTSSNKTATVFYSENIITQTRETESVIEVSNPKYDIQHKVHAIPGIKKEIISHSVKDIPQAQTPKCAESGKFQHINAALMPDYEPVFQSLFEKFEESAQVYARVQKEPDLASDNNSKIKETQPTIFKPFPEDSKDKFVNMNPPAAEWKEDNQSSNKADKCLGNTRTLMAESSPPHKPIMVKSSDAENTSVCTSSCHSNGSETSSVSLEISRFARFARSSQSLSGSMSCVDTSMTFTKVTDVHRTTEETPSDYNGNVVNQSLPVSTVPSNTFNKTNQSEDSRVSSKTPHSQFKVSTDNISTLSSSGDSGSSVDPICTRCASKIASMTGNSSVDGSIEFYFSKGITKHRIDATKKPEAGDASTFSSSTDIDLLPSQRPPSYVKSLTELMREFIRHNGTPV